MGEEVNTKMNGQNTILTKKGIKKLKKELKYRRTIKRKEITYQLTEMSRRGELAENEEYRTIKENQAFNEGRIKQIEQWLRDASVISDNGKGQVVEIGSTVRITDPDGLEEKFRIVGKVETNPRKGLISNESPLGEALLGRSIGDDVVYSAPKGEINLVIEAIE